MHASHTDFIMNLSNATANHANEGGAVWCNVTNAAIVGNVFTSNSAFLGGAVFWGCGGDGDNECNQTKLLGNAFTHNKESATSSVTFLYSEPIVT